METNGWMSTEDAAAEVGMTTEWVRRQIGAGRLDAVAFSTGRRRTFRIRGAAWRAFLAAYSRPAADPAETPSLAALGSE